MSTEIFENEEYSLTEFWGGTERGKCIQITPRNPANQNQFGSWIQLTKKDAEILGKKLIEWSNSCEMFDIKQKVYKREDIEKLYNDLSDTEKVEVLEEALAIMSQSNSRTKFNCIALAMGFEETQTDSDCYMDISLEF